MVSENIRVKNIVPHKKLIHKMFKKTYKFYERGMPRCAQNLSILVCKVVFFNGTFLW